jgi:uncharacterized membrane protein
MNNQPKTRHRITGLSLDHLLLFSDAIFAFAITLLAIDIRVVAGSTTLDNDIYNLLPRFISFILTFWIVANYWINYHRLFRLIKDHDRILIYLTFLFLMFIVLLPFPNDLIGKYPFTTTSTIIYAAFLVLTSTSMLLLWTYVSHHHRLISPDVRPQFIHNLTIRLALPLILFLISIPLAILAPLYAIITWISFFPIGFYFERRFMHNQDPFPTVDKPTTTSNH